MATPISLSMPYSTVAWVDSNGKPTQAFYQWINQFASTSVGDINSPGIVIFNGSVTVGRTLTPGPSGIVEIANGDGINANPVIDIDETKIQIDVTQLTGAVITDGSETSGTNTGDQTIVLQGDITGTGTTTISTLLSPTLVTAGTYSINGQPLFSVDTKGRLTLAANVTIAALPPSGTAGGDLSGSYPNPTVSKLNTVQLSSLATGILKNTTSTGHPSIAVASDFPTLNQNTTGNAATATVSKTVYSDAYTIAFCGGL